MADIFFTLFYFVAWWLAWSAAAKAQRNAKRSSVRTHVMGFLCGMIFSTFIGLLTVPSSSIIGYLISVIAICLLFSFRANLQAGRTLFDNGRRHGIPSSVIKTPESVADIAPIPAVSPSPKQLPPSSISVSPIRLNGGLEDLRAMCRDMVSDGVMDEEEVRQLAAYLDEHFWLTTDGLVKLMADYIRDVLADGEVTTMEGMDVLDLAAAVANGQTLADMKYWEPMAPLLDDEPPKVKRRSKANSSKRKEGRKLDTIKFTYRNAQGDVSQRRVVVHVLDDEYFNGFCLARSANRTFRLDRVIGNITSEETGEIASCWEWAAGIDTEQVLAKPAGKETTAQSGMLILFTGFKRADRDRLEALAIAHGWQVKTAVSKQLFVLCTGPIDAPSKAAKAEELGVLVLTESAWLGTLEENVL